MRTRQPGFTLMELLVTIAIIFILIAIFMPLAGKARENARMTACMSNQRQIMTAIRAFAVDNNEICPGAAGGPYPLGGIPNSGPGTNQFVTIGQVISCYDSLPQNIVEQTAHSSLVVRGYLPSAAVFHCPERDACPVVAGAPRSIAIYHYNFNEYFVGNMTCDQQTYLPTYATLFAPLVSGPLPINLTRCKHPSECIMITEDASVDGQRVVDYDRIQNLPPVNGVQPLDRIHAVPCHIYRGHLATDAFPNIQYNNAVCTFVDGHSESQPVSTTTSLNDPNAFTLATDSAGMH